MKNKKFTLITSGISLLALVLRLYRLGEVPVSLHWDEASWGYNAWSIIKTGRDEYGRFMPLIFKAFGDYKAPIYVYLTGLSIAIFGLNEFAIRFPAAFFGAVDVFLLAVFVRLLFEKLKESETIGLLAAAVLTFSPWHYDYSHGAWEANVLFAFFLAGLIFFFKTIRQSGKNLFVSAIFFGLCFYVYNAAKLILPLTGLGLLLFYGKQILQDIGVNVITDSVSPPKYRAFESIQMMQKRHPGPDPGSIWIKRFFYRFRVKPGMTRKEIGMTRKEIGMTRKEIGMTKKEHKTAKKRLRMKKELLVSGLLFAIIVSPVVYFTFLGGAGGRLKVMSIFSYPRPQKEIDQITQIEGVKTNILRYQIFHNDFHYFFRGVLLRYLNHFSTRFLFFEGDWSDFRHGVPDFGVLNLLDFVFLSLGAYFLVSRKIKNQKLVWFLLFIAPLPAALTRDIIQSLRAYFMVLPLAIISAFGVYQVCLWQKKLGKIGFLLKLGIFGLYLFFFALFWDQYFVHAPLANSSHWQYGYKQTVEFIKDKTDDYERIVFTRKYGQPYVYYLLYSRYPPSKYQKQAELVEHPEGDVGYVAGIDNIEFRKLYWPRDRFEPGVLYVGSTHEIPNKDINPQEARVLKDIYFPDGGLAFRIAETLE